MIDTQRLVETPEGVDLHLTPAGPVARAQAWLLDAAIRGALMSGVATAMAMLGASGAGLYFLALFTASWLYFILFEVLCRGVTPGKRSLGLRVVHDDGTPVGWPASIIRNLLRPVDVLPLGYAAGYVSTLVSRDFRRLGDLAAGTIVAYAEPAPESATMPEVTPAPPPVPLDAGERRAIVEFARRVPALTPERADEIASLLAPLTGGRPAVRRLQEYAAWMTGQR